MLSYQGFKLAIARNERRFQVLPTVVEIALEDLVMKIQENLMKRRGNNNKNVFGESCNLRLIEVD